MMSLRRLIASCLVVLAAGFSGRAEEARLLRFPALHGDQLVFTYAGDLFTVSAKGGVARRLTTDPNGFEMFARFSPDGKTLAFTGQPLVLEEDPSAGPSSAPEAGVMPKGHAMRFGAMQTSEETQSSPNGTDLNVEPGTKCLTHPFGIGLAAWT